MSETSPERPKRQQSGPPGPGGWIVTFTDCMTNLLCFFVLLTTFSSFEDIPLSQIAGGFRNRSYNFIGLSQQTVKDSVVPPRPRQIDHTQYGSEQRTDEPPDSIQNPRKLEDPTGQDAYRDQKDFHLASDRLFWGQGDSLTAAGRQCLHMIAGFMRLVPCHVAVGEVRPADAASVGDPRAEGRALERACAIVRYFTAQEAFPPERFHISAAPGPAPERFGRQPMVRITLLAPRTYQREGRP